jgi:hypothetical protein
MLRRASESAHSHAAQRWSLVELINYRGEDVMTANLPF